mmetsp:Transcript_8390/g.13242  ORF Transcript_8390/g.13242 Transcript_8390/m.13242 type:complete len:188 (-) Transcript_8390:45-608(-)
MTDLCDEENAEQKCEEFLSNATRECEDSPELWVQWANLRLCQCRPEDAKTATFKAVELNNAMEEPEKPSLEVRTNMMKLLIEIDEGEKAEEFGKGLLAVDDQYVETWYLLALLLYNQKKFSDAQEAIQSAIKILETEGIQDEEQAERIQELSDEIDKNVGEHEDEEMDEEGNDEEQWMTDDEEESHP